MPTKSDILNLYFMDARCKLLEIAAYLDRLDRHEGEGDFRQEAFLSALEAMQTPPAGQSRAQTVLNTLSDHSTSPAESASLQSAYGAPGKL